MIVFDGVIYLIFHHATNIQAIKMTGILERTISSIGSLFSPFETNSSLKNLFEKSLSSRTKSEEEWTIKYCLRLVKTRLSEPNISSSTVAKCLAFVVFAEMLGYKAEFAYIHAVKLAQNGTLIEKKIGYLACVALLKRSDPLTVLLVNTILRDISGKNVLCISMALSASCSLIQVDEAAVFLPLAAEKLKHSNEFVRSKAVIALHHFYSICPEQCSLYLDRVQELLGDKDPGVVSLVLQFLLDVAKNNPSMAENLATVLVQIQHQILDGKLPTEYSYHKINAPWMQMTVLRLLQQVTEPSSDVRAVVQKTLIMAKSSSEQPIGIAIICECIVTLLKCKSSEDILPNAMSHVTDLLSRESNNLRYAGLHLLEMILQHCPLSLSTDQQQIILSCLQHPDHAVKRKTLFLLCAATNIHNVEVVCTQVADYAQTYCIDNIHLRQDLVQRVISLTQKYPRYDDFWQVAMLIRLLPLANDAQITYIHRLIKNALSGIDHPENVLTARQKVIRILHKYSKSKVAVTAILQLYVWVISRFGLSVGEHSMCEDMARKVIHEIVELGKKLLKNEKKDVRFSLGVRDLMITIVQSLTFVCWNNKLHLDEIDELLKDILSATQRDSYLSACCCELLNSLPLVTEMDQNCTLEEMKPSQLDFTLRFLDSAVIASLKNGEQPYYPPQTSPSLQISELHRVARESPTTSAVSSSKTSLAGSWCSEDFKQLSTSSQMPQSTTAKSIWTKEGRKSPPLQQSSLEMRNEGEVQAANPLAAAIFNSSSVQEEGDSLTTKSSKDPLDRLLNDDFSKLTCNVTDKR